MWQKPREIAISITKEKDLNDLNWINFSLILTIYVPREKKLLKDNTAKIQ